MKEYIDAFLKLHKLEIEQLKDASNKHLREELVRRLLKKSNLSGRQIAVELGLSREMVRRIVVSEEPSETTEKGLIFRPHF